MSVLSSVLSMCILCLYFVLKSKKKEHFIVEHVGIVPFIFFLFLGHMKQVILFLYLFFFCKLFLFCLKMAL